MTPTGIDIDKMYFNKHHRLQEIWLTFSVKDFTSLNTFNETCKSYQYFKRRIETSIIRCKWFYLNPSAFNFLSFELLKLLFITLDAHKRKIFKKNYYYFLQKITKRDVHNIMDDQIIIFGKYPILSPSTSMSMN